METNFSASHDDPAKHLSIGKKTAVGGSGRHELTRP